MGSSKAVQDHTLSTDYSALTYAADVLTNRQLVYVWRSLSRVAFDHIHSTDCFELTYPADVLTNRQLVYVWRPLSTEHMF